MHNNVDFFSLYVGKYYKIMFVVFSLILMWYIKNLTESINKTTALYESRLNEVHQLE